MDSQNSGCQDRVGVQPPSTGRTRARRLTLAVVAVAAIAVLGGVFSPALGKVVDGAATDGRKGFYFLPPMVPDPGVRGNFDAALTPEADICKLNTARSACTTPNLAEFNRTSTGARKITVNTTNQSYDAAWAAPDTLKLSTRDAANTRYRVDVFQKVGTKRPRLGYADLWVVRTAGDLGSVPGGYVGVVRGSVFKIRFRIQTTAVGLVTVTPSSATRAVGDSQQFSARVVDLHNDPMSGVTTLWRTGPTGIATLSASSSLTSASGVAKTTAKGVGTGQTTLTARVRGVPGTGALKVTSPVPLPVDDAFTTLLGAGPLEVSVAGNDYAGFPAGVVSSFGGGDLGGAVDTYPAGSAVALAGGTVVLTDDGSLTLTSATTPGVYSFAYRVSNSAGFADATVTITVEGVPGGPTALDDAFTTVGTQVNGNVMADNGGGLDNGGDSASTVTEFGGGSLGGSVTTNTAGASVALAGGTLTLGADGALALTSPTAPGTYTFDYRLTNSHGADDATVTINVQQAPTAAADGPSGSSAPGHAWHTAYNASLSSTAHATPSLLTNDVLGYPAATVSSFGGGILGGSVTTTPVSETATSDGHSLTVRPDGDLLYTPKPGFTGTFTFSYRISNGLGVSDATATIAVGARPAATVDTYPHTLVGNVGVNTATTATTFSVLSNDAGDALSVNVGAATNGSVTLNGDGTFTFNPAAGFRGGNASFSYTIQNGFGTTAPATVTIPVGAQVLWFVNNNASACTTLAGECGRLTNPLSSLPAFEALNTGTGNNPADSHAIFLHESATAYTGPITLRPGQGLIGQDANASLASLAGVTLPPHSAALPAMDSANATTTRITSATNGVVLGPNNRLHGLLLVNATQTALTGTGFGTLVVSDVAINTTGQALNLQNGTAGSPAAFTSVTSTGGTNNVRLSGVLGAPGSNFDLGAGALSGSTADAFLVDGGTASVTYAGSISNTAARAVVIFNKSGGTVTLSGPVTGSGPSAIALSSNTGATIVFTGALTLNTSGTAFSATGGGTVQVSSGVSTISAAVGPALRIQNTTIASPGVTFQRVSSTGGANGIVVSNTGTAGGLRVTGNGTSGSGGTIQTSTGDGIALTSTRHVDLGRMAIQSHLGSGINGTDVTNFSLSNSTVSANGDNAAANEAGIRFDNLLGTATLSNLTVNDSVEDNVRITNTSGSLSQLTVSASTFRDTLTKASGNNGLLVQANGTAVITADVDGSSFLRNRTYGVQAATNDSGVLDIDLGMSGANTYSDNNIGVNIDHNSTGTLTFDVANSTFNAPTRSDTASPVNLNLGLLGAIMRGTVAGNAITNANSPVGPGIRLMGNGAGTMTVALTGNSISQIANYGIETVARDGSNTINATYTNNTVTLTSGMALDGIRISSGALSSDTTNVCADLANNNVSTIPGLSDVRVRNRFPGTVFRLENYTSGSATDMTAVSAYLKSRNPAIATATADRDPSNSGFTNAAGCPLP